MSRILIIEDEEAIADLEKDYLELSGFEVEICNRGDTGLARALNEEFDLIILDLMLPEVDGFDICRQVRQEKNTPIIMVSAKKDDIDKIRGLGLRGPLLTADRKGHHLLRVHKARGAHPAGRHPGSSPRAQRCHQRCTAKLRGQADRFPGFCGGKGRHHQQRRGREGPAREMRQGAGPDPAGHPGMADRCRKPVPRHAVHYLPGQCGRSVHPAGSGGNFAGLTL